MYLQGQPSFVRLFKYPNFEGSNSVVAQKSFFKAERTDFYWNKIGKKFFPVDNLYNII